jgi:nitrous oxidase accessory protein
MKAAMRAAKRLGIIAALGAMLAGSVPVAAETEVPSPADPLAQGESLQALVDRAADGETVVVPAGVYEGPIRIAKPLVLRAEREGEAIVANDSDKPALSIVSGQVKVAGLRIVDEAAKPSPSVVVSGEGVVLENLQIRTASGGIAMRDADGGELQNNVIDWTDRSIPLSGRGNGIDLFNSHRVRIAGNVIHDVHDGIYLENSDDVAVEENIIERSRYGVHTMYSNRTSVRGNTGRMNVTGAMIMTARGTSVAGNRFVKQNENVNSQGILLYDAHESEIVNNVIEGNRVGFYIEQSADNRIENNEVAYNFIGVQLLAARGNVIRGNAFVGNVSDAQAQDSADNDIRENYWDAFRGIDADGDGKSDIGYAINPFYQSLVRKRPAFQLFFQSPGLAFLESLHAADRDAWTKDVSPLLSPPSFLRSGVTQSSAAATGFVSAALLAGACAVIFIARRKTP